MGIFVTHHVLQGKSRSAPFSDNLSSLLSQIGVVMNKRGLKLDICDGLRGPAQHKICGSKAFEF